MSSTSPPVETIIKADFFSVLLQEFMGYSLKQCLKFCVKTFAIKYNSTILSTFKLNVLTGIFDLGINSVFLMSTDGLFPEYFYKLKRVNLSSIHNSKILSKKTRLIIMICHFFKNYIINEITSWIKSKTENDSNLLTLRKSKRILIKILNFFLTLFHLIQLFYKLK
jgi:hypothetical protein